jgi:hypothetical protein
VQLLKARRLHSSTSTTNEKFAQIEELIEKEVKKLPLPKVMGDGPAYDPKQTSELDLLVKQEVKSRLSRERQSNKRYLT